MSLSPDALEFQQKVAKAPISGNIDNPEGGFDALVQVLALCNVYLVFSMNFSQYQQLKKKTNFLLVQNRFCLSFGSIKSLVSF